jgi:hypothetical protein
MSERPINVVDKRSLSVRARKLLLLSGHIPQHIAARGDDAVAGHLRRFVSAPDQILGHKNVGMTTANELFAWMHGASERELFEIRNRAKQMRLRAKARAKLKSHQTTIQRRSIKPMGIGWAGARMEKSRLSRWPTARNGVNREAQIAGV